MPAYHSLRFNEVSFKASHNSYDKEYPLAEQLGWSPKARYRQGCSGLELDVKQSEEEWAWSVQHGGSYTRAPERQLQHYLRELRAWSEQRPSHDVVTLHIDLKNDPLAHADFPGELDRYIDEELGRDVLFTPEALMRDAPDLVSGATQGWPTLENLRGRFIVCLTGNTEARRATYAATAPRERLCFCDVDLGAAIESPLPSTERGDRVFFNFQLLPYAHEWLDTIRWFAEQRAFVTRGYVINDAHSWKSALGAGVNILATDQLARTPWARVGGERFHHISET